VLTLAIFGQWAHFQSEHGFYRYARCHLHAAFPTLPRRTQFNWLLRRHRYAIVAFSLHLVEVLGARHCPCEALDGSAVPTLGCQRAWCRLAGFTDIRWSNRLGWYEGFHLLTAFNPVGVITGCGFAPASTKDQPLAETFFALRRHPNPRVLSMGRPALGPYVVDKGVEGKVNHQRWYLCSIAQVICPPKRNSRQPWPKWLRRWLAGIRQIVEAVYDELHNTFRLSRERPHDLTGFRARLASKVALHNFCIWLNQQLGRPRLAFADLLDW